MYFKTMVDALLSVMIAITVKQIIYIQVILFYITVILIMQENMII